MVRWFVCPTVSMVTTGHATGLEKTLFLGDKLVFFEMYCTQKKKRVRMLVKCPNLLQKH